MGRPVVHFEIGCRDKARTAEFFTNLFESNTQESGPATTIDTGAGTGIQGHITALGHEPNNYVTFTSKWMTCRNTLTQRRRWAAKRCYRSSQFREGSFLVRRSRRQHYWTVQSSEVGEACSS